MKVRELIERLEKFNGEAECYVFRNGALDIDSVETLLGLPDVMIVGNNESTAYRNKLIGHLNLKFEE